MSHLSRLLHIITFLTLAVPTFRAQDLIIYKDSYWQRFGFKDASGNIVIKPEYREAKSFSEGLAAVTILNPSIWSDLDDYRWAFIDKTGKVVIQPKFKNVGSFKEGLARVKVKRKWGFIDKSGKLVIQPQYDDAWDFSEGLAPVKKNGKWGYIDKTGKFIILPQFVLAYSFSDGYSEVMTSDKSGYIDKSGRFYNTKVATDYSLSSAEIYTNGQTCSALADVDINIPAGRGMRENTFALVIANENYSRVSEVPYALNDGRILKQYLHKTLGLPEKNIFTVTDASLNDINYNLERIANICKAYRGDASVIVYYAGHGVPDEDTKDAYLLPVDGYAESPATSGVSLKALMSSLESMPTRQTVVFMDACFSGANRNDDMLLAARSVRIKPKENALTKENMVVISASQGNQTAQPYGEKQHGLFTYFLLKKLGESAGEVTLGELSDYIIHSVERQSAVAGKTQTPTVTVAPGNTDWSKIKL